MNTTNTAAASSNIDALMGQAQVFASAWSLVGVGAFGITIEEATAEKDALESMLRAALAAPAQPAAPAPSCECAQGQVCQVCDPVLPAQAGEPVFNEIMQRSAARVGAQAAPVAAGPLWCTDAGGEEED